jgi:hypothetical protein
MFMQNNIRPKLISLCLQILISSTLSAQSWLYLGQDPPGMQPERFPPDNLLATANWNWHSTPTFSPDGTEMFFVKYYTANSRLELQHMKMENNSWIGPELPTFASLEYDENCPVFSPTGDTLYFISTRPGGWIFYTIRTGQDWTEPVALNIPFPPGSFLGWQFALASDGSVYFEIWENGQVDIYLSRFLNGHYQTPEAMPYPLNTEYYEWGTFISPESNFMIFISNRPGGLGFNDLYLSIYNGNGTWSVPINLGAIINSDFEDCYPSITFDSQYFFFTAQKPGDSGLNPYWVDSQVIYDLVVGIEDENIYPIDLVLSQNYPNPFNPSTLIKYTIPHTSQVSIKVFDILGNEVSTLVDEMMPVGNYAVEFDGSNLVSGIYIYRLQSQEVTYTKKMLLMK